MERHPHKLSTVLAMTGFPCIGSYWVCRGVWGGGGVGQSSSFCEEVFYQIFPEGRQREMEYVEILGSKGDGSPRHLSPLAESLVSLGL